MFAYYYDYYAKKKKHKIERSVKIEKRKKQPKRKDKKRK